MSYDDTILTHWEQQKQLERKIDIQEWAHKAIIHEEDECESLIEKFHDITGTIIQMAGIVPSLDSCVHVEIEMYNACVSPHKHLASYWYAHYKAGNPFMIIHEIGEDS